MDFLFAAAQPGQGGGGIAAFLPFIVILAIIYFLMIRPQTKRQKEKETMRGELKKGDKIITMGGIYGTVQGFKEKGRLAVIKVDNNTNLTISKTAIAGLAGKVKDTELEQD
ncbi:MAG: preprotein translocase subunit YajC [Candidatus Neomarinimicrobiota bacterium]|nr:preprotein translocase subunit YajC [Candidatus Neomarinimicrobiota bacterium]